MAGAKLMPMLESLNLMSQKRFLRETLNNLPVLFFVKDLEGRIIIVNDEYTRTFGVTREQVCGKKVEELYSSITAKALQDSDTRIIKERVPHAYSHPITDKSGRTRFFETHKFPYINSEGNVYAIGGIAIDVTDKKIAEEELESSRKALLRSARLAAIGEMAGGIAHEINNPLGVIHGHIQWVLTLLKNDELNVKILTESLKSVQGAMERMQKIVKGLLAFSREAAGDPMVRASVQDVLDDLLELCRARLREHHIDLKISSFSKDLLIECRPYQVSQILLNLLNNAFDALQSRDEKWISLDIRETGDNVEFKIVDSGAGIPPQIRQTIFDTFFTTKEVGVGSGLGLSLARGLAKEHGGSLELDEKAEHTTFVLTLPKSHS